MNIMNNISSEISTSLNEATVFGQKDKNRFTSFALKVAFLVVPGIVLGHYIDQFVYKLKAETRLGTSITTYVILQILMSISVIYALSKLHKPFTQEFQNTYAGLFFVSLFFGMQVQFISNLQTVLNNIYIIS